MISHRAEVLLSFITTTVREESQVTPHATARVRTGDKLLPVLCHCQLGQDIPITNCCNCKPSISVKHEVKLLLALSGACSTSHYYSSSKSLCMMTFKFYIKMHFFCLKSNIHHTLSKILRKCNYAHYRKFFLVTPKLYCPSTKFNPPCLPSDQGLPPT